MKLQSGTYVRERDGAGNLYHSPISWVSPVDGLHQFLKDGHMASYPEIDKWRLVTDPQERNDLVSWLGMGILQHGEYVEIKPHELVDE